MILTSDLHLTDATVDNYRWEVFDHLLATSMATQDRSIYILGDLCDRIDKHSAVLVNKLMAYLKRITDEDIAITCLLGNHDMPIAGPPYWQILNFVGHVEFITKPTARGSLWLLPYTATPAKDWSALDMGDWVRSVFMHQTVNGAVGNNGHLLSSSTPTFPVHIKVYSGDIHVPQVLGNVTYVGSPHPVNFGDTYPCRILQLGNDYGIAKVHLLTPPRKLSVTAATLDDVTSMDALPGDQLKLKVQLRQSDIGEWPQMKREIMKWAEEAGVRISTIEAVVTAASVRERAVSEPLSSDPETIFMRYCEREGLDKDLVAIGASLLRAKTV